MFNVRICTQEIYWTDKREWVNTCLAYRSFHFSRKHKRDRILKLERIG